MITYADKTTKNRSSAAANAASDRLVSGKSAFKFDGRPEGIMQRRLKALLDHSLSTKQYKALQAIATPISSVNNDKTVQRRRQVPETEWDAYKQDKKYTKIYPNRKETKIGDLSLGEAYAAFDTYKIKGEKFKEGKQAASEVKFEYQGYRERNKISRVEIGHYIFIGLLDGDKVILLATRGNLRSGNDGSGKAPIQWRSDDIQKAEVQEGNAEVRVEYKNVYHLNSGQMMASYNFGDLDDQRYGPYKEGDTHQDETGKRFYRITAKKAELLNKRLNLGKRMSNSDILFHQIKLAQTLAGKNEKLFTIPNLIHRHNVVNNDTLFVMGLCDNTKFEKGEVKGGGTSTPKDGDYFAILGTPNGQSAGFMAQQHTGKEGNPVDHIAQIDRQDTQLLISIAGVNLKD